MRKIIIIFSLVPLLFAGTVAACYQGLFHRAIDALKPKSPWVSMNAGLCLNDFEVFVLAASSKVGPYATANRLADYYAFCREDAITADFYYELAAKRGSTLAMDNLGVERLSSLDPKIREEGRRWLKKAADKGNANAREQLELEAQCSAASEAHRPCFP
jgi:TPR repeat protein